MRSHIDDLLSRIAQLEREVEHELNRARARWHYRVEAGRIRFERDIYLAHKRLKLSIPRFVRESRPVNWLTAPVIYAMIVPIAIVDLSFSFYQSVCFPIYGIARVRRSVYIVIDRQHLAYLNVVEKFNCMYCGYANGVIAYAREIAGRTEQYWCPIRHARLVRGPHAHYHAFVHYGDANGYHQRLPVLRNELRPKRSVDRS